jgi:hypothetical protein
MASWSDSANSPCKLQTAPGWKTAASHAFPLLGGGSKQGIYSLNLRIDLIPAEKCP